MPNNFVNFPPLGKGWVDSGEGGLSVALLVTDNDKFEQCYADNYCFVSVYNVMLSGPREAELFPNYEVSNWQEQDDSRYRSIPLNACIAIGSTKNSLWHETEEEYFMATEQDLTEDGKALLGLLRKLYGNRVHILTLLDT